MGDYAETIRENKKLKDNIKKLEKENFWLKHDITNKRVEIGRLEVENQRIKENYSGDMQNNYNGNLREIIYKDGNTYFVIRGNQIYKEKIINGVTISTMAVLSLRKEWEIVKKIIGSFIYRILVMVIFVAMIPLIIIDMILTGIIDIQIYFDNAIKMLIKAREEEDEQKQFKKTNKKSDR